MKKLLAPYFWSIILFLVLFSFVLKLAQAQLCTATGSYCAVSPTLGPGEIPMGSDYSQCVLVASPFLVNTSTKKVELGSATDNWLLKIFGGTTGIESTADDYGVRGVGDVGAGGKAVGVYGEGKTGVIGQSSISGEKGVYGANLSGTGVLGYGDTGLIGVGRTYGLRVYPDTGYSIKNYILGSLGVNTSSPQGIFHVATGSQVTTGFIDALVVDNQGNVGIGTTSPESKLHVSEGNIQLDNGYWLGLGASSPRLVFDGTNGDVSIMNGKVGIGMTNPVRPLDVKGSVTNAHTAAFRGNNGYGVAIGNFNEGNFGSIQAFGSPGNTYLVINKDGGNVGIGATSTAKLHVQGNLTVAGDITASGTISAPTKNFEIDHPTKSGYKLVHSVLEGPEAAVFYRGEGKLVNGQATIKMPDYFETLTRKEDRTILLTAKGKEPYLLSADEIKNGKFKVYGTKPDGEFYWEVKAVRADISPLQVEKPAETQK